MAKAVPTKDDPLGDGGRTTYKGRTLWLGKENMELARENFWNAYRELAGAPEADRYQWDISWAAAIAAYAYIMEGKIEPG
jgi:hypothetical protein